MSFTNPNDLKNTSLTAKIKTWLSGRFGFPPDTEITYTELRCADPACPCVQTILRVALPDGKTKSFKIGKPFVYVRQTDIDTLREN